MLEGRPATVSETALSALKALNVDVRLSTKIQEPVQLTNGKHEVTLSNGEKLVADLYIPTFGVVPNSTFVPAEHLDANGFVKVDEFFRVEGADGVFAIGDVNNVEPPQFLPAQNQCTHLANNMVLSLTGKSPEPYKASTQGTSALVDVGEKQRLILII